MVKLRSLMMVALTVVLLLNLPSLTMAGGWVKDQKTGCEIWTNSATSASWNGACVRGKASGKGTAIYKKDGKLLATIIGKMKDGKFNGKGSSTFATGERYIGEYKDGKYNGEGSFTSAEGYRYKGEFKDDKRHGLGRLSGPDGKIYFEGQWENNNMVETQTSQGEQRNTSTQPTSRRDPQVYNLGNSASGRGLYKITDCGTNGTVLVDYDYSTRKYIGLGLGIFGVDTIEEVKRALCR